MPPAVVAALPLVISAVGTVGGIIQGKQAADQNQQLINAQNQQILKQTQQADRLASSVNRADYQAMASQDSRAALRDVFAAMSARGIGNSTAGMAAGTNAVAQIDSQYGKQYTADRLSVIGGAAGIFGQAASTPRMGYDTDPYAGYRAGLTGLANGAAYMQKNGSSGSSVASSPGGATDTADPSFGHHYKF